MADVLKMTRIVKLKLGKTRFTCRRKENMMEVEFGWQYLKGNEQWGSYFTAMGAIRNRTNTDSLCCGQCLDELRKHRHHMNPIARDRFDSIYAAWELYHGHWRKDLNEAQVNHINELLNACKALGGREFVTFRGD